MTDQATTDQMEACAAMGATTAEHEMLKSFAGTFRAECKMWFGPGDPMISTGTMTNTMILGDRYLHHDYKGDPGGDSPFPEFAGTGLWGYNTTDKRWEGVWCDTASTMLQTEQGQLEGNVWTMKGQMTCQQTGDQMTKTSVVTKIDDDHHRMEMFFPGPDGNDCKAMEINYTRS